MSMKQQTIIVSILSGALLATGCVSTSSSRVHKDLSDASLVGAWRGKVQFKNGAFSTVKDLEFIDQTGKPTESGSVAETQVVRMSF